MLFEAKYISKQCRKNNVWYYKISRSSSKIYGGSTEGEAIKSKIEVTRST